MRSSNESDKAGFDYYLERVQQAKGEVQRETQFSILNSLANQGGSMLLLDLASRLLPADAGDDEITDFWALIIQMEEAELVKTTPLVGDPAEAIQTMDVELTDFGKKILTSGLGTQKSAF
jgi:hypothetical protein